MSERVWNFSAGPAVLPEAVLREAQEHLVSYPGAGMSVMEMSHRSPAYDAIHQGATEAVRDLLGVPDSYAILFLQGGASLQFSMVPMNLMRPRRRAAYVLTGSWSKKAAKEARREGEVVIAASTELESFARVPRGDEIAVDGEIDYLHFTSNNTIFGTQWTEEPPSFGAPLVCDMSSDIMCRPVDVPRYGLIYAGAQKNLGPAGVTLVIVDKGLLDRAPADLHTMLDYRTHASKDSLFNTPPTWAIYVVGLAAKHLLAEGGLGAMAARNEAKARLLYDEIDRSGFYRGTVERGSRSLMNVPFRCTDESLEAAFLAEAKTRGLENLKGHRSVGGIRASIYNAMPQAGVEALVDFMREFEAAHG